MEKATIEAVSPEDAQRMLHKLNERIADLERENADLKRMVAGLETATDKEATTPHERFHINGKQNVIERRPFPNLFRCIIDSVGDLIYVKDQEGAYLACNIASEKFLGLKESEQIGKTDFDFFDREFAEAVRDADLQIMSTGLQKHVVEWVTSSEGNGMILDSLKAPFFDSDGTVAGIVGISRDITEQKQSETKIEQLNTDLAARAMELENANTELEAFNYTVSHDLRKPLTIIYGFCELIQTKCGQDLDTECQEYLQHIFAGAESMNQLIDNLLEFSFLRYYELHRGNIDLSKIAKEVATGLALIDTGRRVTFRISNGITASGDANLLRVVLENLLGNAWKYTAKREESVIDFGMSEVDGIHTYFIRDNGTGFDMEHANKLFKPFQRFQRTDADGHGIGLATVERIIMRHGGKVWAEGKPDNGATFYFTL